MEISEIQPRQEIMEFAIAMERQMRYNEDVRDKSYGWVMFDPLVLFSRLKGEMRELSNELAVRSGFDEKKVQHESMDVSTFGFFLWYQSRMRENNGRK